MAFTTRLRHTEWPFIEELQTCKVDGQPSWNTFQAVLVAYPVPDTHALFLIGLVIP
jgi:hypothetical protein